MSPRAIAAGLNKDGIPSPSGGQWGASTINGNLGRYYGLLYNEAYVGVLIFNRTMKVRDPETGKRQIRVNPRDKWIIATAPHLRIVAQELWDAAQARKAQYRGLAVHRRRRPRHLFSGLTFCGVCGGTYTIKSQDQLACATRREKGTCTNGHTIRVPELEKRALDGPKAKLLSPARVEEFARVYAEERKRLAATSSSRRAEMERRLARLDREIGNIVDAIAEGIASPALKQKLAGLEAERAALGREGKALKVETVIDLHPGAVKAYRRAIEDLRAALTMDETARQEIGETLRRIITAIEIHPGSGRGKVEIVVRGALAEILSLAQRQPARNTVVAVPLQGHQS